MKEQILSFLPPEYPWKDRLFVFPELDSTNNPQQLMAVFDATAAEFSDARPAAEDGCDGRFCPRRGWEFI